MICVQFKVTFINPLLRCLTFYQETMIMKHISSLTLAVAAFAFSSAQVDAAAFQLKETNSVLVGQAFSGTASKTGEVSLQFNNPALMTTVDRTSADASVNVIIPNSTFKNQGSTTGLTGGNGGNGGVTAAVPSLYAVVVPTKDWRIGLGITTPYGLSSKWDSNWMGRYSAIESKLVTININPSVAYRTNKYFSIGAGLSFQYADAKLTKAAPLVGTTGLNNYYYEGLTKLKGNNLSAGFNFGVLLDLNQGTTIGLAYRSKITHGISGSLTAGTQYAKATADLTTPATIDLSVTHKFNEQWSLSATGFWTQWNAFNNITVRADQNLAGFSVRSLSNPTGTYVPGQEIASEPKNYKNVFFFALGGEYKPTKEWGIQLGVAYDQTPIRNQYRDARLPGNDRTWVSVGVNYSFGEQAKLGLGYAHLFVKDGKINQTVQAVQSLAVVTSENLTGKFENRVDIIGLNFTYNF